MEQKDLTQKFKNLPQDLKDAIFDVEVASTIQAIAKKYELNIEQVGKLADEVGLLMLGETRPGDFMSNLKKHIETDPETIKKVTEEINSQIFSKVKESLKKIHATSDEETESAPALLTPSSPIPPTSALKPAPTPEIKKGNKVSPFEEKLKDKVFKPTTHPIKEELERSRQESRYPQDIDPYKESPK